ncbi:MAG: 50S ribosomal protein L5 [Chloroflexi bacterium]|nr:50S ribosomal protein L5 [Chloroflexota bacterium]
MSRLKERYRQEIVPELVKGFGYRSVMQAPRLMKVVVNIGLGEAIQNAKALDAATRDVMTVTGQKPVITRAKKSVAAFKLRAGMAIGLMVTLRGERMYDFVDKLISVALPRVRDFQGVSANAFDGRGNYSLGLREQLVFPEIDYDSIDRVRGMQVTISTSARTDEEGRRLLQLLGMPFRN